MESNGFKLSRVNTEFVESKFNEMPRVVDVEVRLDVSHLQKEFLVPEGY